jgi:16S rRNA (cytosine967-C5)-methyltransferase
MNSNVWTWAADVVAAWLGTGRTPRDIMAELPVLRVAEPAERAAVARAAVLAIAGIRRLEYVLGGPRGLEPLGSRLRAMALVLGAAVEADLVLADGAKRFFDGYGKEPPDFGRLLRADAIVAAGEPELAFGRRHSLPQWFAAAVQQQFGAEAEAVVRALQAPAPRTVRANLLRVPSREVLATELAGEGVPTRPGPFAATALAVDGEADLFATAAYRRGAFEQQDEASQLVAAAVAPPPGGKVLDLCAGSGGKTLALAAALQNRGAVLATDVHRGRLVALRERKARAGADNVQVEALGERGEVPDSVAGFAAHADRILVDAPCSGTGSWRRRPEARWALDERALRQMGEVQDRLLGLAAGWLKPGARLIYATCSLLASENEQRIEALLLARPQLEVVRLAEILGGATARPIADGTGTFLSLRPDRHGTDGFFAAVVRRRRT